MARMTVTQAVIDAMLADEVWVPCAEMGWVLRQIPIPGGRVAAFHDDRHLATDGAKRVTTLARRIAIGEISHYWFANWKAGRSDGQSNEDMAEQDHRRGEAAQ